MDVSAYDLLPTAILLLDGEGRVAHVNAAAEELFGCSQRMLIGQTTAALLGDDRGPLQIRSHGKELPVSVAVVPLQNTTPWSALLEVRLLESHMQLERQQQMDRELAAQRDTLRNLAHEIRNPLGGLRGAAQLLEAELEQPGLREYTRVIIAEADRLGHLLDRLTPSGPGLSLASLNIHEVCERVLMLVKAEFPSVCVQRDYDASLPELQGDFPRLLQAMLNMGRNAAQTLTEHAIEKPQLTVRTRVARQMLLGGHQVPLAVVVSCIDNGPGVPDHLLQRIFHPLVTGRANGTGLGLSLAQEFVVQHGGVLECDSRPGHCEFRMILPLILR